VPDDIIVALTPIDEVPAQKKTTAEIWRRMEANHVSKVSLRSTAAEVRLIRLTIDRSMRPGTLSGSAGRTRLAESRNRLAALPLQLRTF